MRLENNKNNTPSAPIQILMMFLYLLLGETRVGKWWISKPLWWLFEWLCSRYAYKSKYKDLRREK